MAKQGVDPDEAVEVGPNRREKLKAAPESWGEGFPRTRRQPRPENCE